MYTHFRDVNHSSLEHIKIETRSKMKINTTIATLGVLSVLSFGAFAAQPVTETQTQNLHSVGVISVSGIDGTPSDIRQALSDKADQQGAKAFRVIEARNEGNYHATAEIYQ